MNRLEEIPLTIKFFLYERYKKSITQFPLYVRLVLHRSKADFSLGKLIDPAEWNSEAGRFNDTSKHNRYQNNRLSEIEGKIISSYQSLAKDNSEVTAIMVKDHYLGKAISKNDTKLIDYIDSYIAEIGRKVGEYKPGTVRNFTATRNHLHKFLTKNNMLKLKLKDFNNNCVMEFETHLLSEKMKAFDRPMKLNSSNKYLTKLKTVIINARKKGLVQVNPFQDHKIKNDKSSKVYLTKEEIHLLMNHKLSDNVSLQTVRDIFVVSIFTGLRYSDSMNLTADRFKKDDNGKYWIVGKQCKTDAPIEIPLLDEALVIIERYKHLQTTTGFLLPRLSNQKINSYLKEIARLTNINKNISHHVGRHTFATTVMLERGIDIKTVSSLLGHSSLKSTEVYAKVTRKHLSNVIDKLNQTGF